MSNIITYPPYSVKLLVYDYNLDSFKIQSKSDSLREIVRALCSTHNKKLHVKDIRPTDTVAVTSTDLLGEFITAKISTKPVKYKTDQLDFIGKNCCLRGENDRFFHP